MRYLYSILFSGLLAVTALTANASQEGTLNFSSFSVESSGVGDSGPVKVTGTQSNGGITSLRILAFGRDFTLTTDQLRQLEAVGVNGLQISYEGGYRELGGRTVYLVLSTGFTSTTVARKFVVVTEGGSVKVSDTP